VEDFLMHIAVLAKVVPDYEIPAADFDLVNGRAHERYTRMLGLYDENAIEVGVQLKEKYSSKLTIISYGVKEDIPIIRKAIAMGGDELVLITGTSDDPCVIADNLKMAVEQLGDVDLVLSGRQSADMDRGVVPGIMAGMLGYCFIPQVSNAKFDNGGWKAYQITETGIRELQFNGKGVLSITSVPENVPRIPPVRQILVAKKKPVNKIPEIEGNPMGVHEISVEIPKMESVCDFLPMDDLNETARTLLKRLKETRYL
jgi:electron transfer flavoprotein beta subunit